MKAYDSTVLVAKLGCVKRRGMGQCVERCEEDERSETAERGRYIAKSLATAGTVTI